MMPPSIRSRPAMPLVPVIDLRHGVVVRAVRGERARYAPIVSRLCDGAEPATVARALLERCAGGLLYVADLDAIVDRAPQVDALVRLLEALPPDGPAGIAAGLWLDGGFADADAWHACARRLGAHAARVRPVFASEALRSRGAWAEARAAAPAAALSLDRRGATALDAARLWDAPDLWPATVIVMTLERVGSDAGPDLETLHEVRRSRPELAFYGAGGVRDRRDLDRAAEAGAQGWLVASALHDGRL